MTQIEINGETLNIGINLATELTYEEITGRAFDLGDIITKDSKLQTRGLVNAAIACVIANNTEAKTDADYILHNATRQETITLVKAVTKEFMQWIDIPGIADAHVPEPTEEEKEAAEKKD